jgi:TATA-box binding protein (TBP) (component of TFIID and TFIIIB)
MTASELLEQYRKRPADLTPGKDVMLMEIVAAAMVEQAAALERIAGRWVSVDDYLPPHRTNVLVYRLGVPDYGIALFVHDKDHYKYFLTGRDEPTEEHKITHWWSVPLPDAPRTNGQQPKG